MRCVFVCFLAEIEDTKKTFQDYLTFRWCEREAAQGCDFWIKSEKHAETKQSVIEKFQCRTYMQ